MREPKTMHYIYYDHDCRASKGSSLATSMARMRTMRILWHGLRDIGACHRTMRSHVQDRREFVWMKKNSKIWCVKVECFGHFWVHAYVREWKMDPEGVIVEENCCLASLERPHFRLNFRYALIIFYPKFAFWPYLCMLLAPAFLLLRKVQVAFLLVEESRDFYCRINNPRSNPNSALT